MESILVTGSSGFIGMHLCESLLKDGYKVIGIDNMENHYGITLKVERLKKLLKYENFTFEKIDILCSLDVENVFKKFKPNKVVNLAAKAGVRKSIKSPFAYVQTNISGFVNIIEACKNNNVEGLIYASSSSVYGSNQETPFSITDRTDKQISIYAVSKKANELIAHTYNQLYDLNTTGLRFFTVYGPWGRPDMAMYTFADKICKNEEIEVFNYGEMKRDFTYIDDIIKGVRTSIDRNYSYEIFNLGNNRSENLIDMIGFIEKELNKNAKIKFSVIQPGDVKKTFANIHCAQNKLNYKPEISIKNGIPKFIRWYKSYHQID